MLKIGDYVNFILPGSDGLTHQTNDYEGKVLVLYTYPRDNTPGCTIEANGFKTLHDDFLKNNTIVLGLNNNTLQSHQKFINQYCLPFPLLIDKDLQLIEELNAKKEENKVFRKTFIINEKGQLEKIYDTVTVKTHAEEILNYIKSRT